MSRQFGPERGIVGCPHEQDGDAEGRAALCDELEVAFVVFDAGAVPVHCLGGGGFVRMGTLVKGREGE